MCSDVAFSFFGIHLWSKEASRRVSMCGTDWDTCLVTLDGLSLGYRYLLGYHLGRMPGASRLMLECAGKAFVSYK